MAGVVKKIEMVEPEVTDVSGLLLDVEGTLEVEVPNSRACSNGGSCCCDMFNGAMLDQFPCAMVLVRLLLWAR